jgi:bacterial/archaeal transporter family-2 protein
MLFLYGLTILAGIANAIQPGQNATLSKSLGLPITAGLITLLVSTAALLMGGLAIGKLEMPTGQQLAAVPW